MATLGVAPRHYNYGSGGAMQSGIEWGLWIAACSLVVGVAKFVDEYHIRNDIKSTTRDLLISAFFFLDRPKIANFPKTIYGHLAALLQRFGKLAWIAAVLVAYATIVASFYVGRHYIGDSPNSGFLEYALTWVNSVFWAIVLLWGICAGAASFISVGAFLDRWNRSDSLVRQWVISALTLILLAMIAFGTAAGFFILGSLNPESGLPGIVAGSGVLLVGHPLFLLTLATVCLWHAIALSVAMLLLTAFRSLYLLVHKFVLSVLNAASSPKVSPFQYFAALIALGAMTFKVIDEISK